MSWDIALVKTQKNTEDYFEIDDSVVIPFERTFVIKTLLNVCDGIDCSDETWCIYECGEYAFEVSLSDENEITLYVHPSDDGEEKFIELLQKICLALKCRAFDLGEAEFIQF